MIDDERESSGEELFDDTSQHAKSTYDLGKDIKNTADKLSKGYKGNTGHNSHAGINNANNINNASNIGANSGAAGIGTGANAGAGSAAGTAVGTGAGAGAGAGSGAATGATAGSVVPGAGTLVGAGVGLAGGALGSGAAKQKAEDDAQKSLKQVSEEKTSKKSGDKTGQKTSTIDNSISIKVISFVGVILFVCIAFMFTLTHLILDSIAGPVMNLWKLVEGGYSLNSSFISDVGSENPTFEQIVDCVNGKIAEAFEKSYKEVCYQEVHQIAVEQEYNEKLTMESYNNTKFPYILSGVECNVNYSELIALISISDKIECSNFKSFDYDAFCLFLQEPEFLRCLYDLKVERALKHVINEAALSEGDSASASGEEENLQVIITHADGTTDVYNGEAAKAYCEVIVYGEVSVSRYPLKKVFDYLGIDPYTKNETFRNMTEYQALGTMDYFTRRYYPDSEWGWEQRSEMLDYTVYTGELTDKVMNVYQKDINDTSVFKDTEVFIDVDEFKQGDPSWSLLTYGSSTVGKLGCCLTSMAMVCNYFSDDSVTPTDIVSYINSNEYAKIHGKGNLVRPSIAAHYGFKQYNNSVFNLEEVLGELNSGRLIIIHIRPGYMGTGKWGHWVVLNGYSMDEQCFTVKEPASRLESTISMSESATIFKEYQSYGR